MAYLTYCRFCALLVLFGLIAPSALAISVHYGGQGSSMPFELTYQTGQSPLELTLQIANDSDTTASVLAWQLDIELRARAGSHGTLMIQDVAVPSNPLFDQTTEPQCEPELPPPTDSVFIQDADDAFWGEPVLAHSVRNIVQLSLVINPNTAGAFQLVMPYADDPETDSSWFDADEFAPKAFDNSAASDFPGFILLGTINIMPMPSTPTGDYSRDGNVDIADYFRWSDDYGTILEIPGDGADGNRDGVVDAADYVVWRKCLDEEIASSGNFSANVPEPGTLALASLGLACAMGFVVPKNAKRQFS